MNEKSKSQYHKINKKTEKEIIDIFNGYYKNVVFGTLDKEEFPFLSKVIPMHYKNNLYLLLSDLSEHTKNINNNNKSCIYYELEESHKLKLNNPRLTIIGKIKSVCTSGINPSFIILFPIPVPKKPPFPRA